MKRKIYAISVVFLALVFILGQSLLYVQAAEKNDAFAGDRTTTWIISQSDISNYFDGGRPAFELLVRSSGYSWLTCKVHGVDRNLEITMSFSFSSEEEYLQRVSALIGYEPSIIYNASGDSVTLLEGFTSNEQFNWLKERIKKDGLITEFQTESLFKVQNSVLNLNGKTYQTSDRVSLQPEDNRAVVSGLDITTTVNKNRGYERTIVMHIPSATFLDVTGAQYKQSMKAAAGKNKLETADDGDTKVLTAVFSAQTLEELARITSIALNTPVGIHESESLKDGDDGNLSVTFYEEMILNTVLAADASFSYDFIFPEEYAAVSVDQTMPDAASYQINGQEVHYSGIPESGIIRCNYECGIHFDKLLVTTDLSRDFSRITRTITWSLPAAIADSYHEEIMQSLQERMVRGAVLTADDRGGERYYQVTYRAWLMGQINSFSEKMLDGDSKLSVQRGLLFFTPGDVTEAISPGGLVMKNDPKIIQAEYIFPAGTKFNDIDKATAEGPKITFNLIGDDEIQVSYVHTNLIFLFAVSAFVIIDILFITLFIKKRIRQKKPKQAT